MRKRQCGKYITVKGFEKPIYKNANQTKLN